MTKRISKIKIEIAAKNAERQKHAAKRDWHTRRMCRALNVPIAWQRHLDDAAVMRDEA